MNITKFMLSKCKEMDIKQNPRISVSYKGYMDNYIIGTYLDWVIRKIVVG